VRRRSPLFEWVTPEIREYRRGGRSYKGYAAKDRRWHGHSCSPARRQVCVRYSKRRPVKGLLPSLVHVAASDTSSWRLRSLLKMDKTESVQPELTSEFIIVRPMEVPRVNGPAPLRSGHGGSALQMPQIATPKSMDEHSRIPTLLIKRQLAAGIHLSGLSAIRTELAVDRSAVVAMGRSTHRRQGASFRRESASFRVARNLSTTGGQEPTSRTSRLSIVNGSLH